jgi:hypothetical protein
MLEFDRLDIATFSRPSSSGNPRHIAIKDKNHVSFENLWVGGDSDTTVSFVVASQANIGADHFDDSNWELITQFG